MAHNNRRLNINSSVIKAFTIIEYLASVQTAKDLGVISNELGLNKSTVYRFLATLSQLGYVTQEPTNGKYSLGSKVVWLASQFLDGLDLRTLAHPYLQQLSEETGETVHLAIVDNYEVVYIDKIKGRQPVDMRSSVGNRMPAHSTGLGKALLAYQDMSAWSFYANAIGLRRYTQNTITDPEFFYEEMVSIQNQKYAIDNCENEDGIRCVAVPIFDHTGKVIAALSVSGWSLSMTKERCEVLAPSLQRKSKNIAEVMGSIDKTVESDRT